MLLGFLRQRRLAQQLQSDNRPHSATASVRSRQRAHVCRVTGRTSTALKRQSYRHTAQAMAGTTAAPVQGQSQTEQQFEKISKRRAAQSQGGGAGAGTTLEALKGADAAWAKLRNNPPPSGPAPQFLKQDKGRLGVVPEYDVVVCGGTLGIFLATALQRRGFRVAVVERAKLQGRDQEWNISYKELQELVRMVLRLLLHHYKRAFQWSRAGAQIDQDILGEAEMQACITSRFNPIRAGFHGYADVWTRDVLNLGVRPDLLIDKVHRRFEESGGTVREHVAAEGVTVHPDGVSLDVKDGAITARLLVDCMGNFGPIVRQARWGRKPDGVCLVVGTCARGFQENTTGDIIATCSAIEGPEAAVPNVQYFWEAFPAGSGPTDRTTYMFAYMDAEPHRPSLEAMLEDYWRRMPQYQNVRLEDLEVQRILFGFFPTYRDSPLKPPSDRVLQIGDASGVQSPLSFGGFGAMTRHLARLTASVREALQADALDQEALSAINAYSPGLSSAWMLQRAMSVRPNRSPSPDFVNRLLGANFAAMQRDSEATLKTFLQDVVQFAPLGKTLVRQMVGDFGLIPQIFQHVGVFPLLDWSRHFAALGLYTSLNKIAGPRYQQPSDSVTTRDAFLAKRKAEAWEFGSGSDYHQ